MEARRKGAGMTEDERKRERGGDTERSSRRASEATEREARTNRRLTPCPPDERPTRHRHHHERQQHDG